jgi:hypothetical protein
LHAKFIYQLDVADRIFESLVLQAEALLGDVHAQHALQAHRRTGAAIAPRYRVFGRDALPCGASVPAAPASLRRQRSVRACVRSTTKRFGRITTAALIYAAGEAVCLGLCELHKRTKS